MEQKFCKRCNKTKSTKEFSHNRSRKDGYQDYCKECNYKLNKQWIENNPQKAASSANWRKHWRRTGMGKARQLKRKAKERGNNFNISLEEFAKWFEAQDRHCYYCGCKVFEYNELPQDQKRLLGLTIDRKDNNKPYMIDNIAIACGRCNLMKGSWLTEGQMLDAANRYFK